MSKTFMKQVFCLSMLGRVVREDYKLRLKETSVMLHR